MLKLSKLNIQTRSDKPTVLAVAIKIEDPDVEAIVVLVHSATNKHRVSIYRSSCWFYQRRTMRYLYGNS